MQTYHVEIDYPPNGSVNEELCDQLMDHLEQWDPSLGLNLDKRTLSISVSVPAHKPRHAVDKALAVAWAALLLAKTPMPNPWRIQVATDGWLDAQLKD